MIPLPQLVVAGPLGLGVLLFRGLGLRCVDAVAYWAWIWIAGCLAFGAAMQVGIELGAPRVTAWVVGSAGLLYLISLVFRRRKREPRLRSPEASPVGSWFGAFVWLGAVWCLWFAIAGADRPCIEGDEGNIWSLKAKSLLCDWPDLFASAQVYNLHPDYPQLNPLLQAWTYCLSSELLFLPFPQFANRCLVQGCDVALFLAVAGALRHRLPALPAAVLSSLLLLEPEFHGLLRTAYADGMVALGLVVAVDGYLRYRERNDRRYAWLAGLGLAFALWSKNETMLYLAAALPAAVIARLFARERQPLAPRAFLPLLPALAVIANHTVWNWRFGMKSDLLGANPTGKSMFTLMAEQWTERVPAMAAEAVRVAASLQHAHVVFVLLVLGMFLVPRLALRGPAALPLLALPIGWIGIHVVYVGSFLPLRFHLDTSYARVTFQLVPAAIVLLGALASDVVAARRAGHTGPSP